MEDHVVLGELGIDREFLGYVKNQILVLDRSALFQLLVSFDDKKLNKLIRMAEGLGIYGYAEQEILYPWQIKLLEIIAHACNKILLERAIKFNVPK